MKVDMEHLAGLNEKQKEAALHKEGPLLIVAGAGAGKTKLIPSTNCFSKSNLLSFR